MGGVQVGVFTGYSSIAMALALPQDGRLVALDRDPKSLALAQEYWQRAGVADKVRSHYVLGCDCRAAWGIICCRARGWSAEKTGGPISIFAAVMA